MKSKKLLITIIILLIIALIFIPIKLKQNKPETPANFDALQTGKAITLSWDDYSTKTTGYEVYQNAGDGFKLIKTTSDKSYTVTKNLKADKTYEFKIRSYIKTSEKKLTSKFTQVKSVTYTIKIPKPEPTEPATESTESNDSDSDLADLQFDGSHAYVTVNNNKPQFSDSEISNKSYEHYGKLDSLGRCTECIASVGYDIMPTEERGSIGQVKPSGWHTIKFDFVDGKYLYNRCHLIGYQLTAENANPQNLITGTRYLNIDGMLDFENQTAEYVRRTKNHVIYKVTPIFKGNELVARGVQMQAYSVEDNGQGVSFNIYAFNAQPNVTIDYNTGWAESTITDSTQSEVKKTNVTYYINVSSKKIHRPSCQYSSASNCKPTNESISELIGDGYEPCKVCNPK